MIILSLALIVGKLAALRSPSQAEILSALAMLSHLNISALAGSTAMLATVDSLLATQLVGVIVVVTCSHRGSHLPRWCSIYDLTAASQENLLGSIDHARVLIIVTLVINICNIKKTTITLCPDTLYQG